MDIARRLSPPAVAKRADQAIGSEWRTGLGWSSGTSTPRTVSQSITYSALSCRRFKCCAALRESATARRDECLDANVGVWDDASRGV